MHLDTKHSFLKVSVVITIYNKRKYIKRALQSVLNQIIPVNEVILVDDGSTDNWEEEVVRLLENPIVRVLKQSNSGVSVARNNGARAAKNDYVCFLDADDEWLPNFTQELQKLMKDAPHASVFTLRHARIDKKGNQIQQKVALSQGYSGIVNDFLKVYKRGYGVIHSSAICIKKILFDKYEGFPIGAKKSQDIYFWLQLAINNEKIAFRDKLCVLRHEEGSGVKLRSKVIPYHIYYYVVKNNISLYDNKDLESFIKSNTIVLFLSEKKQGNKEITEKIKTYSKNLGLVFYIKILLLSCLPNFLLGFFRSLQLRKRKNMSL